MEFTTPGKWWKMYNWKMMEWKMHDMEIDGICHPRKMVEKAQPENDGIKNTYWKMVEFITTGKWWNMYNRKMVEFTTTGKWWKIHNRKMMEFTTTGKWWKMRNRKMME